MYCSLHPNVCSTYSCPHGTNRDAQFESQKSRLLYFRFGLLLFRSLSICITSAEKNSTKWVLNAVILISNYSSRAIFGGSYHCHDHHHKSIIMVLWTRMSHVWTIFHSKHEYRLHGINFCSFFVNLRNKIHGEPCVLRVMRFTQSHLRLYLR